MRDYQKSLDRIKYVINEFLYQGYEVVNYHLNGSTEPTSNFVVENMSDEDIEAMQELVDMFKIKFSKSSIEMFEELGYTYIDDLKKEKGEN